MRKGLLLGTVVVLLIATMSFVSSAENAKLTISWCCGQQERLAVWEDAAAQYMKDNPTVEIDFVQPSGNYYEAVTTWIVGGTGPDIIWMGGNWQVFLDHLMPMRSFMERTGLNKKVHPFLTSMVTWNGQIYGVVYGGNTNQVFVNKDLFNKAGLPSPTKDWTWDQALQMARRLTVDADGDGVVEQGGLNIGEFQQTYLSWGSDAYTNDQRHVAFNNPVTAKAIQLVADIRSGRAGVSQFGNFKLGNLGMTSSGPFFVNTVHNASTFDWTMNLLPYLEVDGTRYRQNFNSPEAWGIPKTTEVPDLAMDFLQVLMSDEVLAGLGNVGTSIPSVPNIALSSFVARSEFRSRNLAAFIEGFDYAHQLVTSHPQGRAIYTAFQEVDQWKGMWLLGDNPSEVPPGVALPELERQANQMLDEYWATRDAQK